MTQNQTVKPSEPPKEQRPERRPDDIGTISVTGFVKIFDPKTKETFVETRA